MSQTLSQTHLYTNKKNDGTPGHSAAAAAAAVSLRACWPGFRGTERQSGSSAQKNSEKTKPEVKGCQDALKEEKAGGHSASNRALKNIPPHTSTTTKPMSPHHLGETLNSSVWKTILFLRAQLRSRAQVQQGGRRSE